MESLPGSAFSRRPDVNGTMVSIYNTWFDAIAVSVQEADLERAEREHKCNPNALDHWKAFLGEIERSDRRR